MLCKRPLCFVSRGCGAAAFLIFASLVSYGLAQTTSGIVSITETWELVIGEPSPNADAPQVTCVISPLGLVQK